MESTANRFPFDSLPMEMKERILEKVNPYDSMKLLQVNKQLRAYILHRGPLYKRFKGIRYFFDDDRLHIDYYSRGEISRIALDIDNDEGVEWIRMALSELESCSSGKSFDLRLPRSTRSHFHFLTSMLSPKKIEIKMGWFKFSTLNFLQPAITLSDLMPKCHFLDTFKYGGYYDLGNLIQVFSPKIRQSFDALYEEVLVDISERDEYLLRLKAMLVDCKEVNICLVGEGDLLFEALRQSNVETILMECYQHEMDFVLMSFELFINNGIPSRNCKAKVEYRIFVKPPCGQPDQPFFNISVFLEQVRLTIPSVRQLPSNTEYQKLFKEMRATDSVKYDLNKLWIYETSTAKKCIVFFYYCVEKNCIYLIPRYV